MNHPELSENSSSDERISASCVSRHGNLTERSGLLSYGGYGMAGMEVVDIVEVGGAEFTVYGSYSDETASGLHDYYDVYLLNRDTAILELVDLGKPFARRPTPPELEELAAGLFATGTTPRLVKRYAS